MTRPDEAALFLEKFALGPSIGVSVTLTASSVSSCISNAAGSSCTTKVFAGEGALPASSWRSGRT